MCLIGRVVYTSVISAYKYTVNKLLNNLALHKIIEVQSYKAIKCAQLKGKFNLEINNRLRKIHGLHVIRSIQVILTINLLTNR